MKSIAAIVFAALLAVAAAVPYGGYAIAPIAYKSYYSAPAISYHSAPIVKSYYAAPAVSYAAPIAYKTYAAPIAYKSYYSAPIITKSYASYAPAYGYGYGLGGISYGGYKKYYY